MVFQDKQLTVGGAMDAGPDGLVSLPARGQREVKSVLVGTSPKS